MAPQKIDPPLLNVPLWTRYSGNFFFWFSYGAFIRLRDRSAFACWLAENSERDDWTYFEKGRVLNGINFQPQPAVTGFWKVNGEKLGEAACDFKNSIHPVPGFTFLVIQNDGATRFAEIELRYRLVKARSAWAKLQDEFRIATLEEFAQKIGDEASMDRYLEAMPSPVTVKDYLDKSVERAQSVDARKIVAPSETRFISSLAPGESIILLLNVYIPDEKNLPLYYLDDVVRPEEISFSVDGRRVTRAIRPPSGEIAARKTLSWGWFSQ